MIRVHENLAAFSYIIDFRSESSHCHAQKRWWWRVRRDMSFLPSQYEDKILWCDHELKRLFCCLVKAIELELLKLISYENYRRNLLFVTVCSYLSFHWSGWAENRESNFWLWKADRLTVTNCCYSVGTTGWFVNNKAKDMKISSPKNKANLVQKQILGVWVRAWITCMEK